MSELNLDKEVREMFESTGRLLEKAFESETTNPINLIFLAGDYFAREREIFLSKDPNFMGSEQYKQGCEYLAEQLRNLDETNINHRKSYELLTQIIRGNEMKYKITF